MNLIDNRFGDRPRLRSDCMARVPLVCLVDDADDYRLLVETIFKRFFPDYSFRSFVNGPAFLAALPQLSETPDLILLDQYMPLLSGYQTLVTLKQQTAYQSTPVVMMSVDASHSEIASFYQARAAFFLPKPMDFHVLEETLLAAYQYAHNHRKFQKSHIA